MIRDPDGHLAGRNDPEMSTAMELRDLIAPAPRIKPWSSDDAACQTDPETIAWVSWCGSQMRQRILADYLRRD